MHRRLAVLILFVSFAVLAAHAQSALPPDAPAQPQPAVSAAPGNLSTKTPRTEDWSKLPLAQSGLQSSTFNAVLLSKVEQPQYTRELLRVEWRRGDNIDLYIIKPHGVTKPPTILYLYDYKFDTDRFREDGWCLQATRGGFAAVGFVSALSGQRFHAPRPMKEWFVSELQEALATSTHDVQMILNYLVSRGDVDASQVGIFAQGSGGAIAVLAAGVDSRIQALDLLNPWGDWPDWLKDSAQIPENERADYLKPEFLQQVSALDPLLYLPHLQLKALRLQQILDDTVTPPSARDKIAAAAPHTEQVDRYKDTAAHVKAWRANGLNGWLRQQLQPAPLETASKLP